MNGARTIVVGIDGAHFDLIERWVADGDLQNVGRIIDDGVSADLESVLPPVTSPNWKAYATGKNPGKIGIYWWENVDADAGRIYYPTERKHVNTEFWEIIAQDTPTGVLGVPTTYPPKAVGEFLIAGPPDAKDSGYASPSSLEPELEERFDYRVTIDGSMRDAPRETGEEILDLIDLRFEVARSLCEEYDLGFLQVTTFYVNTLHHYFWDDELTKRGWQRIDAHVGALLEDEHNVVLMSDHGSNPIETVFHVNTWLEREGYLTPSRSVSDLFHSAGITLERLSKVATALGVRSLAKRWVPDRLIRSVPTAEGEVKMEGKSSAVDWDETVAIGSGQGPVYLTLDADDGQYEPVRREIIDKLQCLTAPDGKPVAREVYRGESIYEGPYLDDAPDLVIDQGRNVHIPGTLGRDDVFTTPDEDGWRAENKRTGLFAAKGPDFGEGGPNRLSILDLAPTLIHLHGGAIPESMDGEVRTALFSPESDAGDRRVEFSSTTDREAERTRIRRIARRVDL